MWASKLEPRELEFLPQLGSCMVKGSFLLVGCDDEISRSKNKIQPYHTHTGKKKTPSRGTLDKVFSLLQSCADLSRTTCDVSDLFEACRPCLLLLHLPY